MPFTEKSAKGFTTGTTVLTVFTATVRTVIRNIVIHNKDTASVTITATVGGTTLFKVTLQSGYRLTCDDISVVNIGESVQLSLASAVSTLEPEYVVTYAEVT